MDLFKSGRTDQNKKHSMDHQFLQNLEPSFPNGVNMSWVMTDAYSSNQRRAKKLIPDNQKDEVYWERRKKNNVAAKKSRENKRKHDLVIRDKLQILEEENALLRREICVLKARFGIPADISILTNEERENCLMSVRVSMQDTYTAVDDVIIKEVIAVNQSTEHCRTDSSNGYTDSENSPNGKAEFNAGQGVTICTPFGGAVLAMPAHVQSLHNCPSPTHGYFYAMPDAISTGRELPVAYQSRQVMQHSPCSTESSDSDLANQEPTDLSINGNRRYDPDGRSISQSPESNRGDISTDVTNDENRQLKNENDDIRNKLQQLSEQVSRMQQLIYTKQDRSK